MEMRAVGAPLCRAEQRELAAFVLPTLQVLPLCHLTATDCPALPGQSLHIRVSPAALSLKIDLVPGKGRASLPAAFQGVWGPALGAPGSARGRVGCHC